jgi:hypothetical protein
MSGQSGINAPQGQYGSRREWPLCTARTFAPHEQEHQLLQDVSGSQQSAEPGQLTVNGSLSPFAMQQHSKHTF